MKNLSWTEPTAYRRAVYRESMLNNPWKQVLLAIVVLVGIMGFRVYQELTQPNGAPSWPLATAIAVAGAFFFALFVPWLQALLPCSIVIFSEKGVNNNIVNARGQMFGFSLGVRSVELWPRLSLSMAKPIRSLSCIHGKASI